MNETNNQHDIIKQTVIQSVEIEISNIIDEWCKSNANGCSGGEMRERGVLILRHLFAQL